MRCIRAAPLNSDCYCGMGNSFVKIGRVQEALEAYTAAVQINPQVKFSSLVVQLDCKAYTAAVQINPQVKFSSLVVQVDCKAYTAAVQINPQEPGYLNNVGNLLVRHQRFNTTAQHLAIKYLLNAIEFDGGYADGYFNLGEAYSAMGQHDHAVSAIRAAMRLVCV